MCIGQRKRKNSSSARVPSSQRSIKNVPGRSNATKPLAVVDRLISPGDERLPASRWRLRAAIRPLDPIVYSYAKMVSVVAGWNSNRR